MCQDHEKTKANLERLARDGEGAATGTRVMMDARNEKAVDRRSFREIDVSEVENGFAVKFRRQSRTHINAHSMAILGVSCDERVFVAKNLEEVTEIILSEGRKAA